MTQCSHFRMTHDQKMAHDRAAADARKAQADGDQQALIEAGQRLHNAATAFKNCVRDADHEMPHRDIDGNEWSDVEPETTMADLIEYVRTHPTTTAEPTTHAMVVPADEVLALGLLDEGGRLGALVELIVVEAAAAGDTVDATRANATVNIETGAVLIEMPIVQPEPAEDSGAED